MMGGADEVYPWIFNLADVYLFCGISMVVVRSLFFSRCGECRTTSNSPAPVDADQPGK
jgi:lipoprotein signal peptidase